jgi:hypothetical protein
MKTCMKCGSKNVNITVVKNQESKKTLFECHDCKTCSLIIVPIKNEVELTPPHYRRDT